MIPTRPIIYAVIGLAVFGALTWTVKAIHNAGYQSRVAEEAAATQEKNDAANRADDVARRCSADPDCRLRSDPFERR